LPRCKRSIAAVAVATPRSKKFDPSCAPLPLLLQLPQCPCPGDIAIAIDRAVAVAPFRRLVAPLPHSSCLAVAFAPVAPAPVQ
jgi:hypothetical protein